MEVRGMLDIAIDYFKKELEEASTSEIERSTSRQAIEKMIPLGEEGFKAADSLLSELPTVMKGYIDILFDQENLENHVVAEAVVSYLINPFDILSEEVYGYYGYLDDAIFAFSIGGYLTEKSSPQLRDRIKQQKWNLQTVLQSLPEGLEDILGDYIEGYYNNLKMLNDSITSPKNAAAALLKRNL